MNIDLNNKAEVVAAINSGVPCYKRFGWRWKGAQARPISKETALTLVPDYSPGIGFYELDTETINGKDSIVFNEYSAADML